MHINHHTIKTKLAFAFFCTAFSLNANASNDCTLLTKFSFQAAEAYAKGIPERTFITMTFAGFMNGHKELAGDPKAKLALTIGLSSIYSDVARLGSALRIGGTLKGNTDPSEPLRKKITEISQMQLGFCVGEDNRDKQTKSEACVDTALKNIALGKLDYSKRYETLGKCGNG